MEWVCRLTVVSSFELFDRSCRCRRCVFRFFATKDSLKRKQYTATIREYVKLPTVEIGITPHEPWSSKYV